MTDTPLEPSYTIEYSDDAQETYFQALGRYCQTELVTEVFLDDGTSVEMVLVRIDKEFIWGHEHAYYGVTGRLVTLKHNEIVKVHIF